MGQFYREISVIQTFATVITLFVTVLHAGVGCCWHHTHTCETIGNSHEHRRCTDITLKVHRDHHADGEIEVVNDHSDSSEESRHEHQPCDDEACVFMVGSRTAFVVPDQFPLSIDVPAMIAAPSVGLTTAATYAAMRDLGSWRWDCAHAPQWIQTWLL